MIKQLNNTNSSIDPKICIFCDGGSFDGCMICDGGALDWNLVTK